MKEYKIDLSGFDGMVRELVSREVQRRAFELGYEWSSVGKEVSWLKRQYLFFNEGGNITHLSDEDALCFESHSGTNISAADFLAITKEPKLKQFDRVLVRDYNDEAWTAHVYSHRDDSLAYVHRTVGDVGWHQCIPYEGNEHLLGTTEDVE